MRILVQVKWEGASLEEYEILRKEVNWEGNPPEGSVFHVSAFKDNCVYVSDIWESEKDFNDFNQNRILPKIREKGFKAQPQIEIMPVHAIFAPVLEHV